MGVLSYLRNVIKLKLHSMNRKLLFNHRKKILFFVFNNWKFFQGSKENTIHYVLLIERRTNNFKPRQNSFLGNTFSRKVIFAAGTRKLTMANYKRG